MRRTVSLVAAFMLLTTFFCEGKRFLAEVSSNDDIDYPDLVTVFKELAHLTPENYDAIMQAAGQEAQRQIGLECNPLDVPPTCITLPPDSMVLSQCTGGDPTVDCVYTEDGAADPKTFVSNQAWAPPQDSCPTCFDKLQELWCGMQLPKCGTFPSLSKKTLVPALTGVVEAQAYNQTYIFVAFQEAYEKTVTALTDLLPCREWCEELVSSCGCSADRDDTFGTLLTIAIQAGLVEAGAYQLIYRNIWKRPFCSLLPSKNDPSFTGKCSTTTSLPSTTTGANVGTGAGSACKQPNRWCQAINSVTATNPVMTTITTGRTSIAGDGDIAAGDAVVTLAQAMVVALIVDIAGDELDFDLHLAVLIQTEPTLREQLDHMVAAGAMVQTLTSVGAEHTAEELQQQQQIGRQDLQQQEELQPEKLHERKQQPQKQLPQSFLGLSGGAIVALVVCVTVGLLVAILLGVVGLRKYRQTGRQDGSLHSPLVARMEEEEI